MTLVAVDTENALLEIDLEEEEIVGIGASERWDLAQAPPEAPPFAALAVAGVGSLVVAVVDRRPPLMISRDSGATWRESGGGLPPGRDVAISERDPDLIVYAARNRLYVSDDGGRFWRALTLELPEIRAVGAIT
jgi:hypothetical protein